MTRRLAALICLLLLTLGPAPAPSEAQPSGFVEATVPGLGSVSQPTAFAFLPDGRMLIASKPGRLLLYEGGALRGAAVFDRTADICDTSERGLLGVAIDPAFASNGHVYVYYTFDKHNTKATADPDCSFNTSLDPVNRVSRLTLSAGLTTTAETVLIDNIPSPNGNHNAGDLHFGKDGYLYIATGDGGRNDTARQRYNLDGAILRITADGGIPAGNPYTGAGTGRCYDPAPGGNKSGSVATDQICQEIFAYGLRNPFRIAFDPNAAGTRFFVNDVGQGSVEEISEGAPGADFGWNCFEGTKTNKTTGDCNPLPTGTVQPYFQYQRPAPAGQSAIFDGCASITGGAFVPNGAWPSAYDGAYLFADFVCDKIFVLQQGQGGPTPSLFLSNRTATHLAFGPAAGGGQALYFADFGAGAIRAITYTGGANRSPSAALSVNPSAGDAPLSVSLSGAGSADPDSGDSIAAYLWSFGDGASAETTAASTSHTYQSDGVYTATLRVRDSFGALSAPATARVDVGNSAPTPQIGAPAAGSRFRVGQILSLSGSASDPQDGALAGAALSWEVRRHHADHWHPYHSATGASTSLTAPGPEDLDSIDNSYLEVRLTATDSQGLTSVITREVRPQVVTLSITTEPAGLAILLGDGVTSRRVDAPASVRVWAGQPLSLGAPAGQTAGGQAVVLCGWRHGGAGEQTYTAPGADTGLRAVFAPTDEFCPELAAGGSSYLPFIATAGTAPAPPALPPADAVSARLSVPAGFAVRGFAAGLSTPRLPAIGPDGQLYVAERGAARIVRLPDRNADGLAEAAETVATGLTGVHSLEWRGAELYAALNDRVLRLQDQNGDGDMADAGEQAVIISGLPSDGGHTTRTARFGPDGKLYVAVGSKCNITVGCSEGDPRRAAILRYNADGSIPADNPYAGDGDVRRRAVWAEGLRNSVDFVFTADGRLWATHNGSDGLGDTTPPEEIVIEVGKGAHHGWPQCYTATVGAVPAGAQEVRDTRVPLDARVPSCDVVTAARFTDLAHSAPLGVARVAGAGLPASYAGSLFVAYHGSWNSGVPRDCKLQRIVVSGGAPASGEPFLTGFRDSAGQNCAEAWGRPAGVTVAATGAIFVTDDKNGRVYRVVYVGQ